MYIADLNSRKKKRNCLIYPQDKIKTLWTVVIVFLLIYTAIFVPYKIAFIETESEVLKIVEATVDILFGIDIIVNFISATENKNGQLVVEHK